MRLWARHVRLRWTQRGTEMRERAARPRFPELVNLSVYGPDTLCKLGVVPDSGGVPSARVIVVAVCGHVCSEGCAVIGSIRVVI